MAAGTRFHAFINAAVAVQSLGASRRLRMIVSTGLDVLKLPIEPSLTTFVPHEA